MRVRQTQLGELWVGNAIYRFLQLKGYRSRYVITKQEPMSNEDDRTHTIAREDTFFAAMNHWEKLLPDEEDTGPDYELVTN